MNNNILKLKVEQLGSKNQFIVKDNINEKTYFQSYDSLIAIYDRRNKRLILGCDWCYSNTTMKNLYIFLNEYTVIKELVSLNTKKNKRKYIQELIDKKIIEYDEEMK